MADITQISELVFNANGSIRTNTGIGFDTTALRLGAAGSFITSRTARISLFGVNSASHAGEMYLIAGNTASGGNIKFQTGGDVSRWEIPYVANTTQSYLSGMTSNAYYRLNTSSGSDNGVILLYASGGAPNWNRTSFIQIGGNNHATLPGVLQLGGGNISTGEVRFLTGGGTVRWVIRHNGHLLPQSALNIGSSTSRVNTLFATAGNFSGAVSKGSGSFKIDHPIKPDTHYLVHSFIEGPRADLIYRGITKLTNGFATINLDSEFGMTEGTFVALNGNVQCFTTNEDGWDLVRGKVVGNILTIESNNNSCEDNISWMVIGERHDKHMLDTDWTDESGRVIIETEKVLEEG